MNDEVELTAYWDWLSKNRVAFDLAEAVRAAVLAERERCIQACEAQFEPDNDNYHDRAVDQCITAIRKPVSSEIQP